MNWSWDFWRRDSIAFSPDKPCSYRIQTAALCSTTSDLPSATIRASNHSASILTGVATRRKMKGSKYMKYFFAAVLVASSFAGFSAANAAGGCGPGWHRGPYGGCQPNRGGVVVVEPRAPVVMVRPGPRCPYGLVWRYGRCRPY
jgi:hypothetical protein